jgi:hypothetical protein
LPLDDKYHQGFFTFVYLAAILLQKLLLLRCQNVFFLTKLLIFYESKILFLGPSLHAIVYAVQKGSNPYQLRLHGPYAYLYGADQGHYGQQLRHVGLPQQ